MPSLCLSGPVRQQRLQQCPLVGYDIFEVSSATFERFFVYIKLDMKKEVGVIYKVYFYIFDRFVIKDGLFDL